MEERFMAKTYVEGSTLIGEIVNEYPEAIGVLFACGMHCVGCPASLSESLEEACMVHGLDSELVIKAVNAEIANERKEIK